MRPTALAVLAVVLTVACAPEPAAVEPPAAPEPLSWGACPDDVKDTSLECATLTVPLDYRDPGGRTIEIAISRLAREDLLFYGDGGPSSIHHVAMAINSSEVVHASRSGTPVKVASAATASGSVLIGVKRISA